MSRPRRLALIALGAVAFAGISVVLARYLQNENIERDDVLAVLQAQARGDAGAVLRLMPACGRTASCAATVRADAGALRRPGPVRILNLDSPTAYALSTRTGRTRVAWTVPGRLPVVQCALVRRSGNVISGLSITLLALGAPISNTGEC